MALRVDPRAVVDGLVFLVAHGSIVAHFFVLGDSAFGDLYLYQWWMLHGPTPVIEMDWVYPIGAMLPMALIAWISSPTGYVLGWLALVTAVNAVVFVVVRRRPGGRAAALWWCAFIAALGPVALARLDAFASAAAILATGWLLMRPAAASALLTVAAWIKVAHGFWFPILLAAQPRRWRSILAPAVGISAVITLGSLAAGSARRIFGFVTEQTDRGLQVESVAALPFHLARLAGADFAPSYNRDIHTNEFAQSAPVRVAAVLDLVLVLAVVSVAAAVAWGVRRRPSHREPILIAGLVGVPAAILVFNKVGSPQLFVWLAAPVMAVMTARGRWFTARTATWMGGAVLAAAVVSQVIFPLDYQAFLAGEPWIIALCAVRAGILVALLAWSFVTIARPSDGSSSRIRRAHR